MTLKKEVFSLRSARVWAKRDVSKWYKLGPRDYIAVLWTKFLCWVSSGIEIVRKRPLKVPKFKVSLCGQSQTGRAVYAERVTMAAHLRRHSTLSPGVSLASAERERSPDMDSANQELEVSWPLPGLPGEACLALPGHRGHRGCVIFDWQAFFKKMPDVVVFASAKCAGQYPE